MRHSNRGVDDLIAHGTAVLDSLRSQGANLGSITQKIVDIGQTVSGLFSNGYFWLEWIEEHF